MPRSFRLRSEGESLPSINGVYPRWIATTNSGPTHSLTTATKRMLICTIVIGSILISGILFYTLYRQRLSKAVFEKGSVKANVRCVERDAENVKCSQEKGVPPPMSSVQPSMMHSSRQKRWPNGLRSTQIARSQFNYMRPSVAGLGTDADVSPNFFRANRAEDPAICTTFRYEQQVAIRAIDPSDNQKVNRVSSNTCHSSEASYVTANTSPSLGQTSDHLRPTTFQISPIGLIYPDHESQGLPGTTQSPTSPPPPPPPSVVSEPSISSWLHNYPHEPVLTPPRSNRLRIWIPQTSVPNLIPQRRLVFLKNQATAPILAPAQTLDTPSTPLSSSSARQSKAPSARSGAARRSPEGRVTMRRIGTLSSIFRPLSLRSFRAEKPYLRSESQS